MRGVKLVYCISDIHGDIDRFEAMLKLIGFSAADTLYIIGDVIDRKPNGVAILDIIRHSKNMHMILGNHEQMCIATLGPHQVFGAHSLWAQNGGEGTYQELVHMRTKEERDEILEFLLNLPDHLDISVGQRKYHLVHGYPSPNIDDRLWGRPSDFPDNPPFDDRVAIVGHTPTSYLQSLEGDHYRIWHGEGILDVDCGCGHDSPRCRLACLCLNTFEEFYV